MAIEIVRPLYNAHVVPPGVDTVALTPFLYNSKLVIPLNTVTNASGANNVLVYRCSRINGMPKATGETWTPGDKLYWDNTAKKLTKTSTSNTVCGFAASVQASGDTTGALDLDPAQA